MDCVKRFDARLDAIIKAHMSLFDPQAISVNALHVPQGWLAHVAWCLKTAEQDNLSLVIVALEHNADGLHARFAPGGDLGAELTFQDMLHECHSYCPWCGQFMEEGAGRYPHAAPQA